jgi:hypothetical protein
MIWVTVTAASFLGEVQPRFRVIVRSFVQIAAQNICTEKRAKMALIFFLKEISGDATIAS